MNSTISSLCSSLTLANLWGVIGNTIGFLAISVMFALGCYGISRVIHLITVIRESPEAYDWYVRHKCNSYNRRRH